MKVHRFFWRSIQVGPRIAYALGLVGRVGKFVLLLTTHGRKSGRPRVTPLVYELQGDTILVASARGQSADWLRNIQANPQVGVRVGGRRFDGLAEVSRDPEEMADYLEQQFGRNPRAFGVILRSEGLSSPPSRADLLRFALKRPMVIIRPIHDAA